MRGLAGVVDATRSLVLSPADWLAVLRIGLGLWWLESFRHKDKSAWFERGSGIAWAASVAGKHRWPAVNRAFTLVVAPRPRLMAYVVVLSELAIGLAVTVGLFSPVALAAGLVLNALYFVLMISDWAEQGQNLMMALAALVCIVGQADQAWSIDRALGLFGT